MAKVVAKIQRVAPPKEKGEGEVEAELNQLGLDFVLQLNSWPECW